MKILVLLMSFILISCTSSGGGGGSSSDTDTTKKEDDKSYAFFQANLFGDKRLYMTTSLTEFPTDIGEEVTNLVHMKNDYIFYVKENSQSQDTPYLYNYKTKTEIDLRNSFGINSSDDMKLSSYSFTKGEDDSKEYQALTFLCEKDLTHKVCSVNFYNDSYTVSLLDYEENEYIGTFEINKKPSVCYLDSRLRCHILDYNSFSNSVSYFLLNMPDPSNSWDHVDLVYVFDDYFLVKGGTSSSDNKYYLYSDSYQFEHEVTELDDKTFSLVKSDDSTMLVLGNFDSEFKFWEVNFVSDSKTSVIEGDGVVSPSFSYWNYDDDYLYITMRTNTEGSELYKVSLSNWTKYMLTDSSGTNSTSVESYYEDYVVVIEDSTRKVYEVNNTLSEVSLTYDDNSSLFVLGKFNSSYIFYGDSNSTENTLMVLGNDLVEYSDIQGNSSDPDVSDVRL